VTSRFCLGLSCRKGEGGRQPSFRGEDSSGNAFEGELRFRNLRALRPASTTPLPPPPPPCFYRWWCHRSSSLPPSSKNQDPNLDRAAATTARTKPSSDETVTPPPLPHTARTATALRRRHRISTVLRLTTARSPCTGLVTSDEVVERGSRDKIATY
jgi:hypothetical protein